MNALSAINSIPKKHFMVVGMLVMLFSGASAFAATDEVHLGKYDEAVYGTGAAINESLLVMDADNYGGSVAQSESFTAKARKYNVGIKPTVASYGVAENDSIYKYVSVDPGVYQAAAVKNSNYPFPNYAEGKVEIF
ncbi:hypothetical protein [Halobacillus litoralis]|uniref:Uncharacterized protein n=1 Tax=Halobacillus litoralis TaxID=45668 RepID=A0A410MJF0_9BACI|nr:hypothetical protein [Halobacillus litoralis]QAS54808.1 hypothetical protein HLI_21380 [Halobacillus litoralis]